MKFSSGHIPTLREAPHDADVVSHQLLMRAGFLRKVALGIFNYLPLGFRSLKKISHIVSDELTKAGCQEILMPNLIPSELWEESERWGKYGPELLRIRDRHDREYCFGPTHEEVVCALVRHEMKSYRDYPKNLFQIQNKFRDEIRPRFGLMRGREFLMKDAYSFHTSDEDLDREYQNMHQTYAKIFERCGLNSRAVEADTGSIGGSSSHEFMVLADTGEDAIASCSNCNYTANLEKATFAVEESNSDGPSFEEVHTPNQKAIDEVSKFLGIDPSQMVKCLVYMADNKPALICVAGNREVNDVKLGHILEAENIHLASDEEIRESLDLPVGFIGPVGLEKKIPIHFDISLLEIADGATGANKADYHLKHVFPKRDFDIQNTVDVTNVLPNDSCPKCQNKSLEILRGIEVGHIFKLGTRYSKPMKVNYLDENGKEQVATMGCYGIGVSRTLAACVEQNHDENGVLWPKSIAPFQIHMLTMGKDENISQAGQELYDQLQNLGYDVLWDDRDERAGVKFNDADLIGCPLQLVLGKKSLEKGEIEFKIRRGNEKGNFAQGDLNEELENLFKRIV